MPTLDNILRIASLKWLRKDTKNNNNLWAKFLHRDIMRLGGYGALNRKLLLPKTWEIDSFTIYILRNFGEIDQTALEHQTMWYNKNYVGRKFSPIVSPRLMKLGFLRGSDFFDIDGRIIHGNEALRKGLPVGASLEWKAAISHIRKNGIKGVEGNFDALIKDINQVKIEECELTIGNETLNIKEATHKKILAMLSRNKTEITPFKRKLVQLFSLTKDETLTLNRKPFKHSINSKKRSFVFNFYNGLTYTNANYHIFGVKPDPKCFFCDEISQTFFHLFLECQHIQDFRDVIEMRGLNLVATLTDKERIIGTGNSALDFILMELNYYIHKINYWERQPSSVEFWAWIQNIQSIEYQIASNKNKISLHLYKWDNINDLINI